MSIALRQQIDKTLEIGLAAGYGLTITVYPPTTAAPILPMDDYRGLHPECHRLLTALAETEDGTMSLEAYAHATGRTLEKTRGAMRGAHRSREHVVAMDSLYARFDGERPDGGKMRCYRITDEGRAFVATPRH